MVPIIGSVLDRTVLARLNEGDLIFGCVDKDLPRMILCQYSYQHLVPYLDVGAEIGGDAEGIVSTDARSNYVAPGRWCLRCTGLVTARRLAFESLAATPTFAGGMKVLTVTLSPGTYVFYCSVPGHRAAGMQGTLTVT